MRLSRSSNAPGNSTALPTQGQPPIWPESGFVVVDSAGCIVSGGHGAFRLLGAGDDSSLVGQPLSGFIPTIPIRATHGGENLAYFPFESHFDRWQLFQTRGAPLEIRFNQLSIAEQRFMVLELRAPSAQQGERALQNLIDMVHSSDEVIAITDTEGMLVYVNREFEHVTGYSGMEVLGHSHHKILGTDQSSDLNTRMWAMLHNGKHFHGLFVNRQKNGQPFYEERTARPFTDHAGNITHYVFSGRDVSDRERVIKRLEYLANHDGLTGLPNRNLFMDRLRQLATHAARNHCGFTLLLLDLDHFKAVNDRLGHAAGDALLIAVADRVRLCVRDEDTVARLGGDEFAIILADADTHDVALIVLEKILSALQRPFVLCGSEIPATASIGVAVYPDDAVGTETLIKFADIAMYRAKSSGGNGYHFHCQRRRSERSPSVDAAQDNKTSLTTGVPYGYAP